MTVRFICLKQGHKYGIDYVNILHNRMRHYLPKMSEFVCYTDTPDMKFDEGISVRELPNIPNMHGWWWKCWILGETHPGQNLYMDLDMLITGDCSVYKPRGSGLTGLWNIHHLNSSVLAWQDSLPEVWQRFTDRQTWYQTRGGVVGDQEVINDTVQNYGMKLHYWPDTYTAWIDVKTPGRLGRNWTGSQSVLVCKGPRNPHENLSHPLVQQYWRKL